MTECEWWVWFQLVSKSLERKQPEFLNVDTERLLESLHEQKKNVADDLEEVEQLQGRGVDGDDVIMM